jgi:hypothetical protein
MNGAKLRERLAKGEAVTMLTPHHASSGLAVRLVELGADAIFVDCEHGTWSFEDVRVTAQAIRGAGGFQARDCVLLRRWYGCDRSPLRHGEWDSGDQHT